MSIKPDALPIQSREALESIAKVNHVSDKVYLIGIRGYFRDTLGIAGKNDRNIYDDAIFLVTPEFTLAFNGNADPSVNRPGVAVLKAGVHPYRKGKHGLTGNRKPYPALRPATPGEQLPVLRDGKPSVGIAINIHKGSRSTTSSLGCQTIYPEQWEKFITSVYAAMSASKQSVIKYILVEKPNL